MRMMTIVSALVVGTWMSLAAAQAPAAAPAPMHDSIQKAAPGMCPRMAGHEFGMQQGACPGHGNCAGMGPCAMFQNGPACGFQPMCPMHPRFMMMGRKIFRAGILALLIVNILITILVGLDMAKRSRFNGLWIPILLIAGIPGSIIYSLFRLGDIVAETKKA